MLGTADESRSHSLFFSPDSFTTGLTETVFQSLDSKARSQSHDLPKTFCSTTIRLRRLSTPISPGLATQLWSDGCVAWGVYIFQDNAKVWSLSFVFFSLLSCIFGFREKRTEHISFFSVSNKFSEARSL